MVMDNIKSNLLDIKENIEKACNKVNRNPDDVTLVAVTKTIDVDAMKMANQLNICEFGENRVQELIKKYDFFEKNIKWHVIGHLQSNKVKYIINKVVLIHSVDSISLAKEIDKRAKQKDTVQDVLIEINVANEETKYGLKEKEAIPFAKSLEELANVRIRGLMTVAPYVFDGEENRLHFRKMKGLFEELKSVGNSNVDARYLSMGMTNDYQVAIEEGSNMVRIGTALFGHRN